ncbi:autotransporter outer membrane beta-barrel domain-containing protein [Pusillimonas caeni]|uniref:autotransporter outer membrane beta-barrel domain-containing protein n=1 Tax=Pusillimonas caeni TaxID=1348472 RepID=UPI000E59A85F|nr:autotransporter outer membrane beta-barrel domain-containing protein [Pusillimonas caeni]TFL13429.1 autotransporter outer membrane beta-barrel domain-containing protein [Pusillimonas caeni]
MKQPDAGQIKESRYCEFSLNRLSIALLRSVGLTVALASLGAVAAGPARADGNIYQVKRGADGRDGETAFTWKAATRGENAPPVFWTQYGSILNTTSSAIEIGSVGGAGGSVYTKGVFHNEPAKRGGNGDTASLTVAKSADISGTLKYALKPSEQSSPLITVYSIGGTGGLGYTSWTESEGGIGRGGDGGRVVLNIASRVTAASGPNPRNVALPAIKALSQGGAAGVSKVDGRQSNDGTYESRVDTDRGGSGGTVSVTFQESANVSVTGALAPAVSASSLGGNGGRATNSGGYPSNAGDGGDVDFTNWGTITSNGSNSTAVIVQSAGGAGGNGANGAFTSGTPGSRGGAGGIVRATNGGTIGTQGAYSFGIMAQSVGGVGGSGGGAAFVSGGDGGGAGLGRLVSITNYGTIKTTGAGASAIMAQSIGGGSALDAFHAAKPAVSSGGGSGGNSGILPFTSGGTGGLGGVGGDVKVEHRGNISTAGDSAYGVLLQSIGGGGGTGGAASSSTAFLAVALGGAGGGGGIGGEVTFTSQLGRIETVGKQATAVLAQSIGGGGGTGGYATSRSVSPGLSASSATGGSGGKGGKGGKVKIDNTSTIRTQGEAAIGLQASSIGGGGGTGGGASAFAVALPIVTPSGKPLPSIALTNAIGGSGGDGGQGSAVDVFNKNAGIETYGVGATGILSQSIGGGGGNAGNAFAYGLAIAAPGASAFNVSNTIGGSGGGGGTSEYAKAYNDGSVLTHGDGAIGIHVQSIGGGGGAAGSASASADALSLYRTIEFGQTIGGTNSKGGGKGGTAHVENHGLVETRGTGATGILLQSIGGGGGSGGAVNASASSGLSFDKTLNSLVQKLPLADSVVAVNALGGNGGNGGDGGIVTATLASSSLIRTRGAQADGLLAQSIGGGGGTGGGGSAVADGTLALTLSMGGKGGAGGSGKTVEISNAGKIETYGDASHGMFAQSIGGGGGNGGNLTAAGDDAPDTVGEIWATLKKAVGVEAYQKWAADKKNAETKENLDAFIKDIQNTDTYKSLADAFKKSDFYKEMQASGKKITDYLDKQSKGAVKRPDVSLTASLGGNGGQGNQGGAVKLSHTGNILTAGHFSHGILAQSIGGGGGQGGVAYASGTNKTNLSATLGGKGGGGNTGGYVEVKHAGTIQTYGEGSYGVFAQSIGGGGGNGVGALSSDNKNLVLNFTAGGNGGTGADGGYVQVFSYGKTQTHGDEAHAIVAQSVGAGGGAFMMSSPSGKTDAPPAKDEKAASDGTIKALLKAVGIENVPAASQEAAGKKPSSKSGSFTLGGSGGASGAGGRVDVRHSGAITTSGVAAFGILAQSIGGGGGISNAAGSPGGVKYAASYGGKGGAAGNGGSIYVHFSDKAAIKTSGDHSTAVFAQSIGGGGGYGGASVLQGWTLPVFGGSGGSSGDGGYIEIRSTDGSTTIETSGTKAHGVFAQSLGGGGGTISDALKTDTTARAALEKSASVLADIIKKTGGSGTVLDNIDKVPSELQGVVRLFGNDKDTVDSVLTALKDSLNKRSASQGTGSPIWIQLKGDIKTNGVDSHGVFAQSGFQQSNGMLDPGRAGGNITVDYSGILQGGSGDGAAIVVDGGKSNTIVIGAGSHVSALSGRAVTSTFGEETLRNYGTLVGDIDLAHGNTKEWNGFTNEFGGTYISADNGTLNISNGGGWFYNAGAFDVGGIDAISTATVNKVDVQLSGSLLVDVNSVAAKGAPNADLLKASKITVDGVAIKPHAVEGLLPGSFTVVSASTLETKKAATAGASPASPISWTASQSGNNISISPSADFVGKAEGGLTDTERSLLDSLQQAWDADDTGVAGLFADLANVESAEMYTKAISSLASTEDLGQSAVGQTLTGRRSLNAALSCPLFEGAGVTLRESQCVWARVIGSRMTQNGDTASDGFTQDGRSYRMGGQWEVRPDWFFGATAAYSTSKMHTSDGLTSIKGDSGDVSVSLKHQTGPWLLAGALHAGYGSYDSNSLFMIGEDWWSAANTNEVWTAGLRLRAAYEVAYQNWYIRPYADLDVLHTYMPGYTLTGDGATLQASSMKEWSVAVEPTIEAGTRINLGKYGWLRPYASVGATFINNKGMNSEVTFSENGGRGITFSSTSTLPHRMFNLGAGLQLYAQDKYELRAEYKGQMASGFRNHELSLRASIPF